MIKNTTVKTKITFLLGLGVLATVTLGCMNFVSLQFTRNLYRQSAWANYLIQNVGNATIAQGVFLRDSSAENSALFKESVSKVEKILEQPHTQDQHLNEFSKNFPEYNELSEKIRAVSLDIVEKIHEQRQFSDAIIHQIHEGVVNRVEQNKAEALMQAEEIDSNEDTLLGLNRNLMELVERQELNLSFLLLFHNIESYETKKKQIDAELSTTLKNLKMLLPSIKDQELIKVCRGMEDRQNLLEKATAELVDQWHRQKSLEARLQQLGNSLKSSATAFLKANEEKISTSQDRISQTIIVLGVITSLGLLVLGYLVARSIVGVLGRVTEGLLTSSGQVALAAGQVSSTSQSLAEGTSEQAASIEESSSFLEEMASMTRQNSDSASQADSLVKDVTRKIESANTSMGQLTDSIAEIANASQETSKIIKTIDEIAFQTNLLALNAAVEAARAGEAGAGFAVVADEVRNLALRAAEAAQNTTNLIEGTVNRVRDGSVLVNGTNEAFTEVAINARKVVELVSEIAAASNEQSTGIDQINSAVSEMDKVIQHNAANAEESSSASEELNAQADQMNGFVEELVVLIGGSKVHERSERKPNRRKFPPTTPEEGRETADILAAHS